MSVIDEILEIVSKTEKDDTDHLFQFVI